jgi:hypothetical protein
VIGYDATVDAYQCDSSNGYVRSSTTLSEISPLLTICVDSNSTIKVEGIENLILTQDNKNGVEGAGNFTAVTGGVSTFPSLVVLSSFGNVPVVEVQ